MKQLNVFLIGFMLFAMLVAMSRAEPLQKEHDTCAAHEDLAVPKYRIERSNRIDNGRGLVLFVSIRRSSAKREDLIALGCALGKRFAARDAISAYIFTDRAAAKSYNPQGEGNSRSMIAAFKGVYTFVRSKGLAGQVLDLRTNPNSPYTNIEILLGPPPKSALEGAKDHSDR